MKTVAKTAHDDRERWQRHSLAVQEAPATYAMWKRVRIGNALKLINGRAFKPSEWSQQGRPIVRIQNLNDPDAPFNYYDGELPAKFGLKKGDLLFAWSGTPGTSFGAHIWRGEDAWLNQHIFKVNFDERQFDKRFLRYAINQNLNQYIALAHGGAGLAHITKGKFEASTIICPPVDEQRHIVAEIERQFSRLEEAVGNIKRVRGNVKCYRAAILMSAIGGRLVPPEADLARREGRSYETGAELLCRILEVRRKAWNRGSKYKEPEPPDTTDVPELPAGWAYASAEQITDANRPVTYGVIKLGESLENGVPVLRSSDVRQLRIDLEAVKTISTEIASNYRRTFLSGGEIVITIRGTLGGVAVVPPKCRGFNISREVAMLALIQPGMAPLLALFIASSRIHRWLMRRAKGIAYTGINIETLKALPIPIPPVAEQARIIGEVERRLSLVREFEADIETNLRRAQALRHAVLIGAFSSSYQ